MHTELYDTLSIPPDAAPDDIKAAYRGKAKQHHPDKGGDPEKFGAVQKAYDILSDPERRARYDRTGSTDTTDKAARIEAMARDRIASLILEILQNDERLAFQRDWIAHAKGQVANQRTNAELERQATERKKATAGKLAARFKVKEGVVRNIPGDILAHVQRELDRGLEDLAEKIEVLERIGQMLDDYTFEADRPNPYQHTANVFTSTSTWG